MFKKRNPPVGSRPGTLAIPEGAAPPSVSSFAYSAAGLEEGPVTDLSTLCNDERVNWVDVQGMGDEAALWRIAKTFGIQPLALEDAVNAPQRAKVEDFGEHLLIIARTPVRDARGRLSMPQVSIFVGDGYVVTFQEHRLGIFNPVRERIRSGTGPIRTLGSDYLAYALLDTMIDRYYPVVEELAGELDQLEVDVMDEIDYDVLPAIYRARRDLVLLRRIGGPQRTAVQALAHEHADYITDDVHTYLRDTHHHISHVVELIESSRDLTLAVMDMYLSTVGNRTNEIMKMLTLMASIFIPLTFIAGIYGMNFDYMPELHEHMGYPIVLLVMLVLTGGMLWFFYYRGWIGSTKRQPLRPLTGGKIDRELEGGTG